MHSMTGQWIDTCPWRAFLDPFVQRVLAALKFMESGQLAFLLPNPTHRLVEGISYYLGVDNQVHGMILDHEREERRKKAGKYGR